MAPGSACPVASLIWKTWDPPPAFAPTTMALKILGFVMMTTINRVHVFGPQASMNPEFPSG